MAVSYFVFFITIMDGKIIFTHIEREKKRKKKWNQ